MNTTADQYLFPYELVPLGSSVLIYGAGELGQAYYSQLHITNYCNMVGFVDRNFDDYKSLRVPVYAPDEIFKLRFDYVVLAFRAGDFALDVKRNLMRGGIPENKIVYIGIRSTEENMLGDVQEISADSGVDYAYTKEGVISVALRYGSGLGDAIIQKGFFNELSSFSDRLLIDIYCPKADVYIESFYSDCHAFNIGIRDGGGLYTAIHSKYDLAISAVSIPRVDSFNGKAFEQYPELHKIVVALKKKLEEYKLEVLPFRNFGTHIRRMQFLGRNCYTSYNYTDDFHIEREKVTIPVDDSRLDEFRELNLKRYITLNYGTGMSTSGNRETISKQWPFRYYDEFVGIFKEKYPDIEIVQLGDSSADKIHGVDRYILGTDIELVKHILINSMFHLDCEGGLVHLASVLGTICIVLFGPTQMNYFGYPSNINLVSDKCSGCYGLYDTAYKCAREMHEPECMYSLTPELVMKHVDKLIID